MLGYADEAARLGLIAPRMKKNPRKMEVFHAFIGVMAFIAYALPFMFVTKSLSYRFQALSDRADFQLEHWDTSI